METRAVEDLSAAPQDAGVRRVEHAVHPDALLWHRPKARAARPGPSTNLGRAAYQLEQGCLLIGYIALRWVRRVSKTDKRLLQRVLEANRFSIRATTKEMVLERSEWGFHLQDIAWPVTLYHGPFKS